MFTLIIVLVQAGIVTTRADTQSLVDSTVVVPSLNYYTISRDIDVEGLENVMIEGTIDVSDGYISLYIMDSSGYQRYEESGKPEFTLYRADNIQSHSLKVPIDRSGTYYIVLSNDDLFVSKTVRVQLNLSFERPIPILQYAIIGVIAVAVLVAVVAVIMRRRRKTGPHVPTAIPAVSPEALGRKYCAFCGAVMHPMAKTCPACGREQRR